MTLRTNQLTRQQIGQFIGSERGVRAFEDVQADLTDQFQQLSNATFLTLGQEPILGSERVLAPVVGDLTALDGGANGLYSLGLATVTTAGTYGDDTTYPVITIDAKGRVTGVSTRAASSGSGTVTSVALTVPTGLSVTGSPITTSGTLAITTTLTGYVKGNGSGFTASATVPGSDLTGAATAAGLTMSTARLLGRTTAGTGAIEEVTVGDGLGLAANALTKSLVGAKAYHSTTQSIPNSTSTAATFDTNDFATSGTHSTSTNPTRFVLPVVGKWRISYKVNIASLAQMSAFVCKNGSTANSNVIPGSTCNATGWAAATVTFNSSAITDYVELYIFQSSGSAKNIGASSATNIGDTTMMEVEYLGA